jgi:hypothetical protein
LNPDGGKLARALVLIGIERKGAEWETVIQKQRIAGSSPAPSQVEGWPSWQGSRQKPIVPGYLSLSLSVKAWGQSHADGIFVNLGPIVLALAWRLS